MWIQIEGERLFVEFKNVRRRNTLQKEDDGLDKLLLRYG